VLKDFGGPEAIKIAQVLLQGPDDLTDEKLADLSKVKLNVVRKILYILNENRITTFRRVRDKRSGWFVYFWNENFNYLPNLLKERKEAVIEKLESRMRFEETNYFFRCANGCHERYIFVDAMEHNFICPKCNTGSLTADSNEEKIKFLKDTIIKLRNQ
jgi:transcription initiation factor TFIIE subunit alpha